MGEADVACLRQAAEQWGIITRSQALSTLGRGQIVRRLAVRAWLEVFPGIYRVEGAPESVHQRLVGIRFYLRHGFVFAHHCAAALHGLRNFALIGPELTSRRRVRLPGVAAHRVDRLDRRDVATAQSYPVTSVTRTLFDLAGDLEFHILRDAVDHALQRKWTTVNRLAVALPRFAHYRGITKLRELVVGYQGGDGPSESELEARVLLVIEAAGVPRPTRQRAVVVAGRCRRLDFFWSAEKVVIEADGYATHSSPEAFESDRVRNNSLVARGFRVLHWTWSALHDRPAELVSELLGVLGR